MRKEIFLILLILLFSACNFQRVAQEPLDYCLRFYHKRELIELCQLSARECAGLFSWQREHNPRWPYYKEEGCFKLRNKRYKNAG